MAEPDPRPPTGTRFRVFPRLASAARGSDCRRTNPGVRAAGWRSFPPGVRGETPALHRDRQRGAAPRRGMHRRRMQRGLSPRPPAVSDRGPPQDVVDGACSRPRSAPSGRAPRPRSERSGRASHLPRAARPRSARPRRSPPCRSTPDSRPHPTAKIEAGREASGRPGRRTLLRRRLQIDAQASSGAVASGVPAEPRWTSFCRPASPSTSGTTVSRTRLSPLQTSSRWRSRGGARPRTVRPSCRRRGS